MSKISFYPIEAPYAWLIDWLVFHREIRKNFIFHEIFYLSDKIDLIFKKFLHSALCVGIGQEVISYRFVTRRWMKFVFSVHGALHRQ